MASFFAVTLRPRPLALLVCGLLPLAAAAGCGSSFEASDEDAGSGGAHSGSGGATADGESSGGSGQGDDGQNASGGQMATDAPEFSGGAAGSGSSDSGGTGGAGGEEGRPCYGAPCAGACEGNCEDGFTCNEDEIVVCAPVFTTVCGCDGVTFQLPSSCPTLGYDHDGSCEVPEGSYDCNPDHITCLPIIAPEPCPAGEVYAVESSCYGECVPIGQCACTSKADCPDPNGTDEYTCHGTTDRCGPWL